MVDVGNGEQEQVHIHPLVGPLAVNAEGTTFLQETEKSFIFKAGRKKWESMSTTEKEIFLRVVAKKNRAIRRIGPKPMHQIQEPPVPRELTGLPQDVNAVKSLTEG
eukprot:CAMPEP_0171160142 /NCGR_PEP_ID=MMETSP0790-20130122/3402_1 /TAXON_ID=2925 /ORGANISM="Alexandrium catenella, Strain OF101" /LENGTH=105 /DNA_ID=CAMNT_0011624661 /DNA_START=127 /DNA_END=444 /DNA_ORIENTATION=+